MFPNPEIKQSVPENTYDSAVKESSRERVNMIKGLNQILGNPSTKAILEAFHSIKQDEQREVDTERGKVVVFKTKNSEGIRANGKEYSINEWVQFKV